MGGKVCKHLNKNKYKKIQELRLSMIQSKI